MVHVSDRIAAIDAFLGQHVVPGGPGYAAAISDGEAVHAFYGGMADLEHSVPISADTPFHVASISKQFTAFAVAKLAQEGGLSLDHDIRELLPWVPDFGATITPRQMIQHTSGLSDQWNLFRIGGRELSDHLTRAQVRAMIERQSALSFPPCTKYRYCNTGYSLLAELVEVVSGLSFRAYCKQMIFEPLGMTASFINDDASEVVPGRASSYEQVDGRWAHRILSYENFGATSLITTANDLIAWSRYLLDEKADKPLPLAELGAPGRLQDGSSFRYGFALTGFDIAGRPAFGHGGSDAGFRTHNAHLYEDGISAVFLSNATLPAYHLLEGMMSIWLETGTTIYPPIENRTAALAKDHLNLVGAYYHPERRLLSVGVEGEHLTISEPGGGSFPLFSDADVIDSGPRGYGRYRVAVAGESIELVTAVPDEWSAEQFIYRRVEPAFYSNQELLEFVGTYRSEELDISCTIAHDNGGGLIARGLFADPAPLIASVSDRFDTTAWLPGSIVFVRDRQEVTGFRSVSDRHDNIFFLKQTGCQEER